MNWPNIAIKNHLQIIKNVYHKCCCLYMSLKNITIYFSAISIYQNNDPFQYLLFWRKSEFNSFDVHVCNLTAVKKHTLKAIVTVYKLKTFYSFKYCTIRGRIRNFLDSYIFRTWFNKIWRQVIYNRYYTCEMSNVRLCFQLN